MKVRDLFNLNKEFKQFEVIAGEQGLNNEIKSIEVIEIPEGVYWTREGDFMITTGYFLKKNESTFENFINLLLYHKAAGLGIKIGRFIDEIPNNILEIAKERKFPIINIPLHMRYSNILWPVAFKLHNNNEYDNYIVKRYKKELLAGIKTNYNISYIINQLSNYIGLDVYILWDVNFKSIINDMNFKTYIIKKMLEENYEKIISSDNFCEVERNGENFLFLKITGVEETIAHLCIVENTREITKTDYKIIKETIPYLTINLLSNTKKNLSYYKSIDNFYRNILNGKFENNELKLKEEASYFNVDYNKNRYISVIEISGINKIEHNKFINLLNDFFSVYTKEYFCVDDSNRVTLIFSLDQFQLNLKLYYGFYNELINQINYSFKNNKVQIGISKTCISLKRLHYAYDEAIYSLKLGKKLSNDKIHFYDDYMIYHLLYDVSGHPTLSKLYRNTLEKIIKYDEEFNTNLVETLKVYIKCNFSINQTASELYIHRNTLYKRIHKLNEILEFDIDKSESRLILQLAVKLNNLI